ncbi:hypothetical protein BZA77DRAFT_366604 [Pyronema omphalodes]|nr:hypothetical protein BZA77DRAFT_366604 [Pyronema omphalodes]
MVSNENSQALVGPDPDASASSSLIQCPSGNIPTATSPTDDPLGPPTITPLNDAISKNAASYLGLMELGQRLQEAVAENELEKSMLKDAVRRLELEVEEKRELEAQCKILEEENIRLKAELDEASQSHDSLPVGSNPTMTHFLRKTDDLGKRITRQAKHFERVLADNRRRFQQYTGRQLGENANLLKKNHELREIITVHQEEMKEYIEKRLAEDMQNLENFSEATMIRHRTINAKIRETEERMERYSREASESFRFIHTQVQKMEQNLNQKFASLDKNSLESVKSKLSVLEKVLLPTEFHDLNYFSRPTQMIPKPAGVVEISRHVSGPFIYVKRSEMINHNFEDFLFIPMCVWGVDLSKVETIYIKGRGNMMRRDWHKFVSQILVIDLKLLPDTFEWQVSIIMEDHGRQFIGLHQVS